MWAAERLPRQGCWAEEEADKVKTRKGIPAWPKALARTELCLKSPGGHGGSVGHGEGGKGQAGPSLENTSRHHRPRGEQSPGLQWQRTLDL